MISYRALFFQMTLSVIKNIGIKQVKFRCKITIVHNYFIVNRQKSDIKCSPGTPKNQKANKVQIVGNGYRFELDISINPTKILTATIVKAPKTTTPKTTSTTTTSTTTTLFSYSGNFHQHF